MQATARQQLIWTHLDLNMLVCRELLVLTLGLTLAGRVDAGGIVGGHEVAPHARPYMVLLQRMTENGLSACGGFLLNEDFVMTATHCQAKSIKVFLGVHNVNKPAQVIEVAQMFPHEDYNPADYQNDIMLLKLSSKAVFNKEVAPIALADEGNLTGPNSCMASGWGKTKLNDGRGSDRLMEVEVDLISEAGCEARKFYCSDGAKGPYQGDSGGPLVCEDGKAHGVFSNVFGISNQPKFHCFVKIYLYRSWISSTMKKALEGSGAGDD